MNSKQWLQAVNAALCLIPIGTGLVTMMGVADPIYAGLGIPDIPMLDGNLRFFGGVWLVLGLSLAWVIPSIGTRSSEFRIIWIAVFMGGIGRLLRQRGRTQQQQRSETGYFFHRHSIIG